jgi:hypothetical protein
MYLSGMTAKLIFLHSETFDLSGTRVSENDQGNVSSQVAKDMESSVWPNVAQESEMNRNVEPAVDRSDVEYLEASQQEPLGEITEMEIERGDVEVADEKLDAQTFERDASAVDTSYGKSVDAIVEHDTGIRIHVQSDCFSPADGVNASLASECNNLALENGNQPLEETGNDKLGIVDELPADLICDEQDPNSSFLCSGETKVDSTHSVEHDLDVNNASLNGKENRDCQEADLQSIMDGEIPVLDHSSFEDRKVS